jgi:hypothetical protein
MLAYTVNIHDRSSVEAAYPRAVWEQEAMANSAAEAEVLRGILIQKHADTDGNFQITRAARQVGEKEGDIGAVFLCPYIEQAHDRLAPVAGAYGGYPEAPRAKADHGAEYHRFIDRVITAAHESRISDQALGANQVLQQPKRR